jgi:hypothetical protein
MLAPVALKALSPPVPMTLYAGHLPPAAAFVSLVPSCTRIPHLNKVEFEKEIKYSDKVTVGEISC